MNLSLRKTTLFKFVVVFVGLCLTVSAVQAQSKAAISQLIVFDTPLGASAAGPAQLGQRYEINFTAQPGDHLTFATMLRETNDYFYSFNEWGVPLYNSDGRQRSAALTNYVVMWDLGTEFDERPFRGEHQGFNQAAPNTGAADGNNLVRRAHDSYGPRPIKGPTEIIELFLLARGGDQFTLRIRNISGSKTLSPGIVAIFTGEAPLFKTNLPDYGEGLEAIAEDGNPYAFTGTVASTASSSGSTSAASTAAPATTTTAGQSAAPINNEASAIETTSYTTVKQVLLMDRPLGGNTVRSAERWESFTLNFTAAPGDKLSFANKLVGSEDLLVGSAETGIPLYDVYGTPLTANVVAQAQLWQVQAGQPLQAGMLACEPSPLCDDAAEYGTDMLWVFVRSLGGNRFSLTVLNRSAEFDISPGVIAIHTGNSPLFTAGATPSSGLVTLAQDGNPYALYGALR